MLQCVEAGAYARVRVYLIWECGSEMIGSLMMPGGHGMTHMHAHGGDCIAWNRLHALRQVCTHPRMYVRELKSPNGPQEASTMHAQQNNGL